MEAVGLQEVEFDSFSVLSSYKFATDQTHILEQLRRLPLSKFFLELPMHTNQALTLQWLGALPTFRTPVRCLDLWYARRLGDGAEALQRARQFWKSLPGLEELSLVEPDEALIATLGELPNPQRMRALDIVYRQHVKDALGANDASQGFCQAVAKMTQLQALDWDCPGGDDSFQFLPRSLTRLRCVICSDQFTDAAAKMLGPLSRLRRLQIDFHSPGSLVACSVCRKYLGSCNCLHEDVVRCATRLCVVLEQDSDALVALRELLMECDTSTTVQRIKTRFAPIARARRIQMI